MSLVENTKKKRGGPLPAIKRRIEEAFKGTPNWRLSPSSIHVNAMDGKVTLDGTVKWSERQAAEHAAWSAAGVTPVEDHLRTG